MHNNASVGFGYCLFPVLGMFAFFVLCYSSSLYTLTAGRKASIIYIRGTHSCSHAWEPLLWNAFSFWHQCVESANSSGQENGNNRRPFHSLKMVEL